MNLIRNHINEQESANRAGLAVIGAGLPKTGTLSLKSAYGTLLNGICYHGGSLFECPQDELDFWDRAIRGEKIRDAEWVEMLQGRGVRAGVDLPFNAFYKELMKAFPNAKVILSVREGDPGKWYESCKFTLTFFETIRTKWVARAFWWLCGELGRMDTLVRIVEAPIEACGGKSMAQAVREGREPAIKFYHDWNEDVKRSVPKDRLLVYSVKEGWGPICNFLNLPVPDKPFPRVNDRESMRKLFFSLDVIAHLTVFGLPLLLSFLLHFLYHVF